MNDSEANAIEGVQTLWPTLTFKERMEWVEALRHVFDDDFVTTVSVLSGARF